MEQLIKKNCREGTYENMYPLTVIQAIKDQDNDRPLTAYLEDINHIYLPFIEHSRTLTRQQVPDNMRRRGLWITYISYQDNVITEWYESDDLSDEAWGNSSNWRQYLDTKVVRKEVEKIMSWYKA